MHLCKRVIASIFIENGNVVRRVKGKTASVIGKPEVTVEYLQKWNVDEIMIINMGEKEGFLKVLEKATEGCFLPVTAGGSISCIEDVKDFLSVGADKVVIGKNGTRELCTSIATKYGNQILCLSIDSDHKTRYKEVKKWPVGEIIMHDISRDGTKEGLNLGIIPENRSIPVISMGGVGSYEHIVEGLKHSDAVSVGNLFHFKEISARLAKNEAKRQGVLVRL